MLFGCYLHLKLYELNNLCTDTSVTGVSELGSF